MSNSELVGSDVTKEPPAKPRRGEPRSERDAAILEQFDKRMRLPIIVSAILPIVVVPTKGGWVGIAVGIVTWLVFLVDYVVHARHVVQFRRSRYGEFTGTPPGGATPGPIHRDAPRPVDGPITPIGSLALRPF